MRRHKLVLRTARPRRHVVAIMAGGLAAAMLTTAPLGPAQAGPVIPSMPRIDAAEFTPRVVDDAVVGQAGLRELQQVGSTMYAGGELNTVLSANRATTYTRKNLFSFNPSTGAVTSWAPAASGAVYAMEPSADGRYLYIGGEFRTFDGVSVKKLVKYDLQEKRLVTTFKFPIGTPRVSDLQLVNGRLFVSGNFPGGIVAVNPDTGARTSYFDGVKAAGQETGWSTRIYRFSINPAGNRMVVIGSFTSINGQPRQQVAMLKLGSSSATLSPWYSARWDLDCSSKLLWYTRDVDWLPDGSAFTIVTTGGPAPYTDKLCDTVTLWRPLDAGLQQPVWTNHSGGDTFHSVNATNRAIFVGGHFRWLDNPFGRDTKGPGAVDRLGLGAIDPVTGKALSWKPQKSIEQGKGAYDLYFTSAGLWVAHFEKRLGTGPGGFETHEGLGLLPF